MAAAELLFELANRVDGSSAPGTTTTTSAAGATTNAHQTKVLTLDFDQTTDESCQWQFIVPSGYLTGGTVSIAWFATPTSGNVVWKASIYVATASSSDIDTSSAFNAVDTSSAIAVPGTSGHFKSTSIALTSPGLAAAKFAILMVGRDANHASDTAAGDARVIGVAFSYTT